MAVEWISSPSHQATPRRFVVVSTSAPVQKREITMSTMCINATPERRGTLRGRLSVVPWLTVVPLAVVLAYADGFWMVTLRGAVGSIGRTQEPFATWMRESILILPVFGFAVIGALALAARWYGPALRKPKTVITAALLVVAAGTLVGIAALAASSAYDYHLQSGLLQMKGSMSGMAMGSVASQLQSSLAWQVRSVGYGSGFILVTNLVLVGWVVALRGGRLGVRKTRQ
jgi:hypothetical protein